MVVSNGRSSTYYPGKPDYKGRGRTIKGGKRDEEETNGSCLL